MQKGACTPASGNQRWVPFTSELWPHEALPANQALTSRASPGGTSLGPECEPHLFSHPQFQIRALESQKRQQEIVLRRKTQEVSGAPHYSPLS